jgi:transcriptional regulator with XRE-family HTH domain
VIGNRVRSLRKERGLSQEELGFKAQLHNTYVGAVERGEKNVSIDSLERISAGLGVDLGEILNDLTGPQAEDRMRAFIAQEIKAASPSTVKIVFELLAGRESTDKMRAFVTREIKRCSPETVKTVHDVLRAVRSLQGQPARKNRTRKE